MLKLYGATMSRANRVLWLLKELGIAFEHTETSFQDGSTRTPEFLKLNPNGRVPAIDDDGLLMFESLAINLYLAKKHPSTLSPADLREDALATQWSFWAATEIEKPLLLAAANRALFAEAARNADEAGMALRKLARPLRVLDAHLAQQAHLLSNRFTIADLNVAAVMSLVPTAQIPLDDYPQVRAWLAACLARPAAAHFKHVKFSIPRPKDALGMLAMFV